MDTPRTATASPSASATTAGPNTPLRATRSGLSVMCSVVFALALRELKTRLDGRWGGAIWVIGEPLLNTAAMLAVYTAMRAHTIAGVDALVFLVSGQLPFLLFRSLAHRLMDGIESNQGLFAYRQVKPIDALLARVLVESLVSCTLLLLCLLGMAWMGHDVVPREPLQALGALGLLVVLGSGLGLLAAAITTGPLARLRGLITMAFMPLYVSSGAIMPLASLPIELQHFFLLNPLAHLLELLRSAWFGPVYHTAQDVSWTLPLLWGLSLTLAGLSVYHLRRHRLQAGG